MNEEITKLSTQLNIGENYIHVHHVNEYIKDNRKDNLKVMTEDEHKRHHESVGERRAYFSWLNKVYGDYADTSSDKWDEFQEWRAKKDGTYY
jgi:hypothetical protein